MKLEDVLKEHNVDPAQGLSNAEVEKSRELNGKNALEEGKKQPLILKFLEQFKDVLIIILIIAAIVSVIVDPHEYIETIIIFVVVILNAVLGVFQENKAEKSLEALKKMSQPNCRVLRNGEITVIPSEDIVVGDIIYIEAGDKASGIRTKNGFYMTRLMIGEMMERIDPQNFYMPHRSYIVNLNYIEKVDKCEIILCNGEKIRVSRLKQKEFQERFYDHIRRGAAYVRW